MVNESMDHENDAIYKETRARFLVEHFRLNRVIVSFIDVVQNNSRHCLLFFVLNPPQGKGYPLRQAICGYVQPPKVWFWSRFGVLV